MNKSGTLITTALLTFGFAAASMAADAPKSAAPMAADTSTQPRLPPSRRTEAQQQQEAQESPLRSCDNQVILLV